MQAAIPQQQMQMGEPPIIMQQQQQQQNLIIGGATSHNMTNTSSVISSSSGSTIIINNNNISILSAVASPSNNNSLSHSDQITEELSEFTSEDELSLAIKTQKRFALPVRVTSFFFIVRSRFLLQLQFCFANLNIFVTCKFVKVFNIVWCGLAMGFTVYVFQRDEWKQVSKEFRAIVYIAIYSLGVLFFLYNIATGIIGLLASSVNFNYRIKLRLATAVRTVTYIRCCTRVTKTFLTMYPFFVLL